MQSGVKEWIEQLKDPNRLKRHEATLKLGGLTPDDADQFDDLVGALAWGDDDQVFWATIGIGRLGEAAQGAVAPLIDLLRHPKLAIRGAAMMCLPKIGRGQAAMIVPALIRCLRDDPDGFGRADAARALNRLGGKNPDAIEALIHAISDPEDAVRFNAAIALKLLAPHTPTTVSILRKLAGDPRTDRAIRDQIEVAINRLTPFELDETE